MQNNTCHPRPAKPAIYISLETLPQSQRLTAKWALHMIFFFLSQAEDALF